MPRHKLQTCILIEDSDDQVNLTTRLFKLAKVDLQIRPYPSAEACLSDVVNIDKNIAEQSLLITDLILTQLDGIELIRKLRGVSGFSSSTMGICSGYVSAEQESIARAAGADFFVQKPLNAAAITEICRTVSSLEIEQTQDKRIMLYKH